MEPLTLTSRPLTTDDDWALAARWKRDRDYASIVAGIGSWSEPEIHALYQERWGEGEAAYQLKRLRDDAGDGELRGWFEGEELVAFLTLRETNLLADEGPRLLVVSNLYILRPEAAAVVAADLASLADERGIEETDLTIPSHCLPEFQTAGFAPELVTVRRRWRA